MAALDEDINLGDEVEMENGKILHVFMRDGNRLYGVPLPTNFPRFVSSSERIFISKSKIKNILKKTTEPITTRNALKATP